MQEYIPPKLPLNKEILKATTLANRALANLNDIGKIKN